MSDVNDNECLSYIRLYRRDEAGDHLSDEDRKQMLEHSAQCASCSAWQKQNDAVISLASAMPQFDVSEGLTQKILSAVEKENTPGMEVSLLPISIAAGLAFLVFVPFDSAQSLFSWGIGLLSLFVFYMLMKLASSKEQMI